MDIAGIILAGGLGTRMGNVKKAFLEIQGKTILDRLLDVYRAVFAEVCLAAREASDYDGMGLPVAVDRFAVRSSLTGIHSGLSAMGASHGFFAACDTPFLQKGLVERLLAEVTPEADVVIPLKEDGYREPLCAVYSKRCLPFIEGQLQRENLRIIDFFGQVNVKEVPIARLWPGDPHQVSFFNVNTPDDLRQAERLAIGLDV